MKITVVGTGYVGLVSGACLADVGNEVLCLDLDASKIRTLNEGGIPIYEPGLQEIVKRNHGAGRLAFTTDVEQAVGFGTVQFIAVGTPPAEDGSADLQHVLAAARNIGRHMRDYRVVVDKSTVPVGTADKVRAVIAEELKRRGRDRVRSGGHGRGARHLQGGEPRSFCRFADGGARRRRRARDRDRVEGIPQPGFRAHQAAVAHAGDFRRPQSV